MVSEDLPDYIRLKNSKMVDESGVRRCEEKDDLDRFQSTDVFDELKTTVALENHLRDKKHLDRNISVFNHVEGHLDGLTLNLVDQPSAGYQWKYSQA